MSQPHIYSHQQQYPPADWSHTIGAHQQPAHGHANASMSAMAASAQSQHFNRLNAAASADPPGYGVAGVNDSSSVTATIGSSADERRVLEWIAQLMNSTQREAALLELSKKREQFPQLALILWHSFGRPSSNFDWSSG